MSHAAWTHTRPARAARLAAPARRTAWVDNLLFYGFMFYTFIGTQPFQDASAENRADGNSLDRIVVLSLFALALFVLWEKRGIALACIRANFGLLAMVGFCMASIFWSDYPELTLRRSVLLLFLTCIALAVAVNITDLRRFHTSLFVTLSVIVLCNLLGVVVVPSIAISDIGVKGFYSQKNVAGIVGMITIILGATWLIGANRMLHIVLALVALALTSVFLALTLSKTSMNLTVLGLLIILFFALSEKWGTRFILFAGAIGLLLATSLIVWLATLDFDTEKAMQIVIGDTSFSGRDELWAFTRRHAERRYWLGHGYGAYWDVGLANDPLVRAEAGSWLSSVKVGIINQAHHGYLELWLHVGRPAAAIAALLVIKSALIGAYRTLAGDASVQSRAAFGGFTVMLVLHMLHNLTEASLFMRGSLFCSTVFLGMFLLSRASERDLGGRVPAKQ